VALGARRIGNGTERLSDSLAGERCSLPCRTSRMLPFSSRASLTTTLGLCTSFGAAAVAQRAECFAPEK
jgi:hypothetical protein